MHPLSEPAPEIQLHQQPIDTPHSNRQIPLPFLALLLCCRRLSDALSLPLSHESSICLQRPQRRHDLLDPTLDLSFHPTQLHLDLLLLTLEIYKGVDDAGIGFEVEGCEDGVETADVGDEVVDVHEEGVKRLGEGRLGEEKTVREGV